MFTKNVGSIDRIIRILAAVAIFVLYFTHVITGGFAIFLGIVGLVLFVTGATRFCPCYVRLNLTTGKKEKEIN